MIVHQLLMGKDVANDPNDSIHQMAASMANFTYVVEYAPNRAFLVDPAWDVDGILEFAKAKSLEIQCAVFTHRHLDHTGGKVQLPRLNVVVPGLAEILAKRIAVKVGRDDVDATTAQTGVEEGKIESLDDGDEIVPGARVIHTPGHTPGSLCILLGAGDALLTGDTLFIGSCGRVDLAESDPVAMYESLARLSRLPQTCRVLPGHNYASLTQSTIGRERQTNFAMRDAVSNHLSGSQAFATIRSSTLPEYITAARKALNSKVRLK